MKRTLSAFLLAGLLLGAAGFTQCNYFHSVTVPATDGTAPWIYNVGYDYQLGHQYFADEYWLSSADEQILAIGSAMDDGGAQSISMRWWADLACCQDNVCESYSHVPFGGTIEETQPGGVGSVVSNGIWVGKNVKPRDYCGAGWEPKAFEFWWRTTATDYHGNVTVRDSGTIRYSGW